MMTDICVLKILVCFLYAINGLHSAQSQRTNISVIAVTQPLNMYFTKRYSEFSDHLKAQLPVDFAEVRLFHTNYNDETSADWTISPLILREKAFFATQQWVFICEDDTRLDVNGMIDFLSKFDASKSFLIGFGLHDDEPTIIHHFAFNEKDSRKFNYPNRAYGYVLSNGLIKKLIRKWSSQRTKMDFRIDVDYEIASLAKESFNVQMQVENEVFCNRRKQLEWMTSSAKCISWLQHLSRLPNCGETSPNVFFAVKTCRAYIGERIPFIKRTWAGDAGEDIGYFAEVKDESVPTIKLNVRNQANGHCSKFLEILKWFSKNKESTDWLIVADDDTLLSVPRLKQYLACFDPSEPQIIGERYGYRSPFGEGYDYITGGGGTALSRSAVIKIVDASHRGDVGCPSADSPDDMSLGIWSKNLGIALLHSPLFHQARPMDYPGRLTNELKSISFHKFWNCEPENVYQRWLLAPSRRKQYNSEVFKDFYHDPHRKVELEKKTGKKKKRQNRLVEEL